jgi:hypothetical protein
MVLLSAMPNVTFIPHVAIGGWMRCQAEGFRLHLASSHLA